MALVQCSICKMNTLISYGKCQNCGSPLKVNIWKRNLRKREFYSVILVVVGLTLIPFVKPIAVITILLGVGLFAYGVLTPRVRQ